MGQIVPFFVQTCILSEDQRENEKKNVAPLTDVDKQQVDGHNFTHQNLIFTILADVQKTGHLALCLLYAAKRIRFSSLLELRPPAQGGFRGLSENVADGVCGHSPGGDVWVIVVPSVTSQRVSPSHLQCVFSGI